MIERRSAPITLDDFGVDAPKDADDASRPRPFHGYFACALTNISDDAWKRLHEVRAVVDKVCRDEGINLYVPMDSTSPTAHPDVAPQVVFSTDRRMVARADILLLYANSPSYGAGQELEIARHALIPILILVPKGVRISRMVHGSPTFKAQIEFETVEELGTKLKRALGILSPHFDGTRSARALATRQALGLRIGEERRLQGLSVKQLADRVGITEEEMATIENDRLELANPSALVICRLAQVLALEPAQLFNPAILENYEKVLARMQPVEEVVIGARGATELSQKDRLVVEQRYLESLHRAANLEKKR